MVIQVRIPNRWGVEEHREQGVHKAVEEREDLEMEGIPIVLRRNNSVDLEQKRLRVRNQ